MLRKESKAVPEGNGPVSQQEEFGSGQPTPMDVHRKIGELGDKKMDEITRLLEQYLTRLEHVARQPSLAMEANGPANTKTHERTEGTTKAVQAKHRDSCSAGRVDPDPMCSTSFGDDCTTPPARPCSGKNALVDNGAAAPKSCLLSLEMRSPAAAGGLLFHRRNLYGNEDHLQLVTSSALPN